MRRQDTWCRSAADALFHHSVTVSCHGPQVLSNVAKCNFPTRAVYEAFVDSGAVMEGTEGTVGGGMVPRRTCATPSYLAPQPFNLEHASVPAHRQPRYPVRNVESGNTPPLEDPFSRWSGVGPTAYRNIFGTLGIVIRHG